MSSSYSWSSWYSEYDYNHCCAKSVGNCALVSNGNGLDSPADGTDFQQLEQRILNAVISASTRLNKEECPPYQTKVPEPTLTVFSG